MVLYIACVVEDRRLRSDRLILETAEPDQLFPTAAGTGSHAPVSTLCQRLACLFNFIKPIKPLKNNAWLADKVTQEERSMAVAKTAAGSTDKDRMGVATTKR